MTYKNPFKTEQPVIQKQTVKPLFDFSYVQNVNQVHHFYTRPFDKQKGVEWTAREIRKQYGPNVLIMVHSHPFGFECDLNSENKCKMITSSGG